MGRAKEDKPFAAQTNQSSSHQNPDLAAQWFALADCLHSMLLPGHQIVGCSFSVRTYKSPDQMLIT